MLQHYVRFFLPGFLTSEEMVVHIDSREEYPKVPHQAFGFEFFDRQEVCLDGQHLVGREMNTSPQHIIGHFISAAEIMRGDNKIMKSNVKNNGFMGVVKTKFGQHVPCYDDTVVIDPQTV